MSALEKPIHDGHPQPGYYKLRDKMGVWQPVAIWKQDGALVARVGSEMRDPQDIWLWCAKHRVDKADAMHAFQYGEWPGDAPAPIGDNNPPSEDPHEEILRELDAERARVEIWIAEKHEGKTAADKAANWLVALRKLEQKTVGAFDLEKAPALAETRRIDEKWRDAKDLASRIKRMMQDAYDTIARKEQARLQAIANAEAAKRAAEAKAKWEAEHAEKKRLAAEHNIHVEPEEEPQLPLTVADPVRVSFGGATASKVAPRKIPPTAVVSDWAKAAAHYSGSPKLQEIIQKLANADAKNGVAAPGVTIVKGE